MPLLDHFRPPLSVKRHWQAFHSAWATYLSSGLNRHLSKGYFAGPSAQFGILIDALFTDFVEVTIFHTEGGPVLTGAIELVSPANKDRPAHRDAFMSKCQTRLQQGIGLVVVDVVTDRRANLHNELLQRFRAPADARLAAELYAVSYRPVSREGQPHLDLWPQSLAVGQALPTVPLWLRGGLCLPVELEAAYERTCLEQRVTANGA
jgi:Protein of unknown function (DUF4058)